MRNLRSDAITNTHDVARFCRDNQTVTVPNGRAPEAMQDIKIRDIRNDHGSSVADTDTLTVDRRDVPPYPPLAQTYTDLREHASSLPARPRSPMLGLPSQKPRSRLSSPWTCSLLTLSCSAIALSLLVLIGYAFTSRPPDNPKGCRMSYMRANFVPFRDFDTEHTRFASKYSLYLYREGGIDDDARVKGIPVLFIPGNAGSYKQVRPIAAEAAYHHHNTIQHDPALRAAGKRPLDFFTVDFNEDITAFHGQTLLEQADYLNDAVAFILSLYTDPNRALRDASLPDPTSVIVVGHSMGGVVARTMLTRSKYVANSINTILTLSAPHIRPPVSFDSDMVAIYNDINNYWRQSYAQQWASRNPLWHVTLISIAGGGLDTVVPSDYASLHSLIPDTHGFTVYTSTIPHVWTGVDHLAIMWCDQFRKSLVRALYDVVNVNRPAQTIPRSDRMRAFRKRFLTGMEPGAERSLEREPSTFLTLSAANQPEVLPTGQRLDLSGLGTSSTSQVHIMPIPAEESNLRRFTLLSDLSIGPAGSLDVLFCTIDDGHGSIPIQKSASTGLACKSAHVDAIAIPSSEQGTKGYTDEFPPFSHLSYDLSEVSEFQFVVVVDKSNEAHNHWVIAEFTEQKNSISTIAQPLETILRQGVRRSLSAVRPIVTTLHVPAIHSSLLSYRLDLDQRCDAAHQRFLPLVRQYTIDPHESRYFVNPTSLFINLHSTSPYLPPPAINQATGGLSLQIWTDPACQGSMEVSLQLDMLGSAGQLYMRYRTAFGAFPTLVIALVLRKQFTIYNRTGVFVTFAAAMDECIRTSLPLIFLALTFLALSLTTPGGLGLREQHLIDGSDTFGLFSRTLGNDLLLGFHDRFFWFLIPLFGIVSVGVCIAANYVALFASSAIAAVCKAMRVLGTHKPKSSAPSNVFVMTSPVKRLITTGILLALVATVIPYQFAYMVLCIVQLVTCVRAQGAVYLTSSTSTTNFHAYAHSLLVLMLWILPINLPVLIVWIHNLAVHWLTPFSSHHNILSIMPFILLVELLSTGRMVPRMVAAGSAKHTVSAQHVVAGITNVILFGGACIAAVYGVTYAYLLHQLVNALCAWLLVLHMMGGDAHHTSIDDHMGKKDSHIASEISCLHKATSDKMTFASGNNSSQDELMDENAAEGSRSRRGSSDSRRQPRDRKPSTDPLSEHRRPVRAKK